MRTIDEIQSITETHGPTVGAVAAAIRAMVDSRTGWLQSAQWAIGERLQRSARTVRRAIVALASAGVIEVEAVQDPDCLQRANRFLWRGVGAYERKRIREARLAKRERQRQVRALYNHTKRLRRAESLADMIARRVKAGVEREIRAYWQGQASISAPDTRDGVLQVAVNSEDLESVARLLGLMKKSRQGSG